jgi:hypothetical protein
MKKTTLIGIAVAVVLVVAGVLLWLKYNTAKKKAREAEEEKKEVGGVVAATEMPKISPKPAPSAPVGKSEVKAAPKSEVVRNVVKKIATVKAFPSQLSKSSQAQKSPPRPMMPMGGKKATKSRNY